jgi:hypothetical protein
MKKNSVICLLFFMGFWIVFLAMQHEKIYFNTLGRISKNYYHLEDGTIGKEKKPYEKITDENVLHWDGEHYYAIKENGYSVNEEWRFAFFPLFSYYLEIICTSPLKGHFFEFLLIDERTSVIGLSV